MKAQDIAPLVLKSADTVRRTIRRYEAEGLDGLLDRRHDHPGPTPHLLGKQSFCMR